MSEIVDLDFCQRDWRDVRSECQGPTPDEVENQQSVDQHHNTTPQVIKVVLSSYSHGFTKYVSVVSFTFDLSEIEPLPRMDCIQIANIFTKVYAAFKELA